MSRKMTKGYILFAAVLCCAYSACSPGGLGKSSGKILEDNIIRLEVTPAAGIAVFLKQQEELVPLATGTEPAFLLVDTQGKKIPLELKSVEEFKCEPGDPFGSGKGLKMVLVPPDGSRVAGITVRARMCLYDSRPGVVVARTEAEGLTGNVLAGIQGTRFFAMTARADLADKSLAPYGFHLFQGAVYRWGEWYTKIKLTPGYDAPNWTVKHGEKQPDGGGLPVDYLWTKKGGLALAHIDTVHRVAALPVKVREDGAVELALEQPAEFIRPDVSGRAAGLPVMIGAFRGDYFEPLRSYAELLQKQGFKFAVAPPASYQASWCSWGFARAMVPGDILRTLPEVKSLSIPWVTVDDGYQASIGYWPLDKKKFPRGDRDMRALVDSIHAAGLKAELWWAPMNAGENDPLYAEHPEWLVLDKNGQPKKEAYWKVYQLCPAYPPVVDEQRKLVQRFMKDWDYDGFKMDGGCQDMVSPCYNPAHNHARPEESCEAVAALYAVIRAEAESIKPGCLLMVCECGIPPSPYKFSSYNQQVTADPVSSDQVRARIKMYRALFGRGAAPFGDHVELATGPYRGRENLEEGGRDFASTLALGGVIGSKFTTLVDDPVKPDPKKYQGQRSWWKHYFELYNRLRLYEGDYLNLYDIAYDLPETHAVARGDTIYYGIFVPGYSGKVFLRGLKNGVRYALTDYDNGDKPLGEIQGEPDAALDCTVDGHLLVRAAPLP